MSGFFSKPEPSLRSRDRIESPAFAGADTLTSAALIEDARTLSLLYDISKELASILDLQALLRAVGERVKLLVDYDLFIVMLLNPESQRLEHTMCVRYDRRIHLMTTLALGEGLCGTAALERKPILVNQVAFDPRYVRCQESPSVQSELVIPLIVNERLLGVLDFESLKPAAFTPYHERALTTLASTVAIAIENAQLYEQLRRAEQRKAEDLERAREVQQLLLPAEAPRFPGLDIAVLYSPAQELGGDFYDFLPYINGSLAIAVGDVSGKGPAAALLASLGVGILREHAVHQPSPPGEMLADLNGHLQVPGRKGRFIAMAFGVFDPASRELSVASAGFPRPILVHGGQAATVAIGGVPLGLFPDSRYESVCLRLEPGDVVVFCSDGILEQTNVRDEEFGIERLIRRFTETRVLRTAEDIAGDIMSALDEHAGITASGGAYGDDRTIVVLRVV